MIYVYVSHLLYRLENTEMSACCGTFKGPPYPAILPRNLANEMGDFGGFWIWLFLDFVGPEIELHHFVELRKSDRLVLTKIFYHEGKSKHFSIFRERLDACFEEAKIVYFDLNLVKNRINHRFLVFTCTLHGSIFQISIWRFQRRLHNPASSIWSWVLIRESKNPNIFPFLVQSHRASSRSHDIEKNSGFQWC